MNCLRVIVVLLSSLILFTAGARADLKPLTDETCPPQPKLPNSCTYNSFICPEGYALKPSFSIANALSTGVYACIPVDEINGYREFDTCYYFNPACLSEVNSSAATRNYFEKILTENFNVGNTNETYVDKLIDLATFNPDYLAKLESAPVRGDNALYLFIADAFKKAADVMFNSSLTYVLVGIFWIVFLFGAQAFVKERFLQHPGVFLGRILLFSFLFFIPIPHTAGGSTYFVPVSFDVTRYLLKMGNGFADEMAFWLNTKFLERVILKMADDAKDTVLILQNRAKDLKPKIKQAQNQLDTCLALYSYADFLHTPLDKIPDADPDVLKEITAKYGKQYRYYFSKQKCREIELTYKRLVNQYNSIVVQYRLTRGIETDFEKLRGVNVSAVASNPENYLNSPDKNVKAIAWTLYYQKKMGWLSFPLFTLPMGHYLLAFTPKDLVGEDVNTPSWPVKAVGILSFPPGNMIFSFLSKFSKEVSALIGAAGGTAVGSAVPVIGNFLGGALGTMIGYAVGAVVGTGAAAFVAYHIAVSLLELAPILILAAVVIVRFVMWIIGTAKLVLASPFVVLHTFSTRNYHNAYRVVMFIGATAMFPVMMVAGILLGYFAVSISGFLIYDLGCKVLEVIQVFGGHGLLWEVFVKFPTKGILYFLSILVQIYLAFKIPMRAPEWFLDLAGFRELSLSSESGIAGEITETLKSRSLPV